MPDLYAYMEYRDFLKDAYEEKRRRHSFFSYRFIGNKVGMDSSYLTRLFQKKLHLGDDLVDRMGQVFGLDEKGAEYFRTLVSFGKARTEAQARLFYDRLSRLRGVDYKVLKEDERVYFSDWVHAAMRSLLDFAPFDGDYEALGARLSPQVSGEAARNSVFLLERLGLVRRNDRGYEIVHDHVHSGDDWIDGAVREFQKGTLELAARALESVPAARRDISTMTMDIDAPTLEELRVLVREFQENVAQLVGECASPDRVYHLNMQLFPLSRLPEEGP